MRLYHIGQYQIAARRADSVYYSIFCLTKIPKEVRLFISVVSGYLEHESQYFGEYEKYPRNSEMTWIEITSNDPNRVLEDLEANIDHERPGLSPFFDYTVGAGIPFSQNSSPNNERD